MGMAARIHITANFILAVLVVNTIGTPLQWEQIRPVGNGPRSRYMHASASFESAQVKSRFAPCILDKKTGADRCYFLLRSLWVALSWPHSFSVACGRGHRICPPRGRGTLRIPQRWPMHSLPNLSTFDFPPLTLAV